MSPDPVSPDPVSRSTASHTPSQQLHAGTARAAGGLGAGQGWPPPGAARAARGPYGGKMAPKGKGGGKAGKSEWGWAAPGAAERGPGNGTGTGRAGARGRWGSSQSQSPVGAAGTGPVSGCSVHRWRQRRWQQRGQSTGPEGRRQCRQGERVGRRGPGEVRVLCPSTWRLVPPAGLARHSPAALPSRFGTSCVRSTAGPWRPWRS